MWHAVWKRTGRVILALSQCRGRKETIRLLHRLFPLRHCRGPIDAEKAKRPCLNRHIDRCLAPCAGSVSPAEYRCLVDEVLLF